MKYNLTNLTFSQLIILTFCITGTYDVILRFLSLNYNSLPSLFKNFEFIKYLTPYFKQHTLLAAALIAGFVGAVTQPIILLITPFPKKINDLYTITFLLNSFIISGLIGFVMKASKLFPILDKTYYKNLEKNGGVIRSLYHDGISGLIVQISIITILLFTNNIIN